ncbi:MAG: alkaline shock response membrane anchor protein AmaP [Verrucomicrobiota bacterium]|nr:alkaline shock response membrane anchor protein AmaP [Verrucomicrobiota bacterium]
MSETWIELLKICIDNLQFCIIGIGLFVLVIVAVIKRQPNHVVAYTTDSGSVTVSRAAIVELVQSSCAQIEAVSRPRVTIMVKGRTAHFKVRIKLASGGRLRDVEHALQNHLRKSLSDNLGIEHLGKIDVIATGFKGDFVIDSAAPTLRQPDHESLHSIVSNDSYEEDEASDSNNARLL